MILSSGHNDAISLERREIFAATRDRVFAAWTKADIVEKWWGPPGSVTLAVDIDLRVGGHYRFTMQFPSEDVFHIYGVYREIQPPEKLVFTWECDREDLDYGETLVTIEFLDLVNATEVVLRHERISTPDARMHFGRGWDSEMVKLRDYLSISENRS